MKGCVLCVLSRLVKLTFMRYLVGIFVIFEYGVYNFVDAFVLQMFISKVRCCRVKACSKQKIK